MFGRELPPGSGRELTDAEKRLVECAVNGTPWRPMLSHGTTDDLDPEQAENWPATCDLDTQVIRCLVTGAPWKAGDKPWPIDRRGMKIVGARIGAHLDLSGCDILAPLWFVRLAVGRSIVLIDSTTRTLSFSHCRADSFHAERTNVVGDFYLIDNSRLRGPLILQRAHIHGNLECNNSLVLGNGSDAVNADSLRVDAHVMLFQFKG
jgi:hypothetical protein